MSTSTPEQNAQYHRTYNAKPEVKALHADTERRRRDRLREARPSRPVVELPVPTIHRPKKAVIAEFNYMLEQSKVNDWGINCDGREDEFVMYATPPTADVAAEMCAGCPMLALCLEKATVNHEGWGVWGGVAFVDGKPYTGSKRQERMEAA
jgi:hypothetical protein